MINLCGRPISFLLLKINQKEAFIASFEVLIFRGEGGGLLL